MQDLTPILDNLPIAHRIVQAFCFKHGIPEEVEEANQEAYLMVSEAYQKWKPSLGPFEKYVAGWVWGALKGWLRRKRVVRNHVVVPLEWEVEENAQTNGTECSGLVRLILLALTDRERFVINHYYGLGTNPKSDAEIGRIIRRSKQRVNEIRITALDKLRTLSTVA